VKQIDEYSLTPEFAKSLRQALTGENRGDALGENLEISPNERVSMVRLDDFARTQWENILGYIVGSSGAIPSTKQALTPPPLIVSLLQFGDLVALSSTEAHGSYPRITKAGFSFVLQPISIQLWILIFLYVKSADQLGLDEISLLSFVFVVLSLELGLTISISSLSETQHKTLRVLDALGIVYCPDDLDNTRTSVFYPTQLAGVLASDNGCTSWPTNSGSGLTPAPIGIEATRGSIIIETNFRLYVYTSSPLQIALLSLFVDLRSRHPNLVTGKLTRRSVQSALQRGISAQQIISYLSSNAHPQMRRRSVPREETRGGQSAVLPATIVDQIHLWQLERDRMRTTSGFLLHNYASAEEYRAACRRAAGFIVWRDDEKRMFFINVETVEQLKMFLG
jgi:transcription initiation factor TFIIH subunit 4